MPVCKPNGKKKTERRKKNKRKKKKEKVPRHEKERNGASRFSTGRSKTIKDERECVCVCVRTRERDEERWVSRVPTATCWYGIGPNGAFLAPRSGPRRTLVRVVRIFLLFRKYLLFVVFVVCRCRAHQYLTCRSVSFFIFLYFIVDCSLDIMKTYLLINECEYWLFIECSTLFFWLYLWINKIKFIYKIIILNYA